MVTASQSRANERKQRSPDFTKLRSFSSKVSDIASGVSGSAMTATPPETPMSTPGPSTTPTTRSVQGGRRKNGIFPTDPGPSEYNNKKFVAPQSSVPDLSKILIVCNGCNMELPPYQPYLRCMECAYYTSCVRCRGEKRVQGDHTSNNEFHVVHPSGPNFIPAPGATPSQLGRPVPDLGHQNTSSADSSTDNALPESGRKASSQRPPDAPVYIADSGIPGVTLDPHETFAFQASPSTSTLSTSSQSPDSFTSKTQEPLRQPEPVKESSIPQPGHILPPSDPKADRSVRQKLKRFFGLDGGKTTLREIFGFKRKSGKGLKPEASSPKSSNESTKKPYHGIDAFFAPRPPTPPSPIAQPQRDFQQSSSEGETRSTPKRKEKGTAAAQLPKTWAWFGEDKHKSFGLAMALFDAVFDYIDNMYEPYAAGKLSPEKFILARCFWLPPGDKLKVINTVTRGHESLSTPKDWSKLLPGGSQPYNSATIKVPYITRDGFRHFCTLLMFAFPDAAFSETLEILNALPQVWRENLPHGPPSRNHFPFKGKMSLKIGLEAGLRSCKELGCLLGQGFEFDDTYGRFPMLSSA
ncbi:hypothetical protein ABW19_dt0209390 [Dactylella cylindrospora]|nr:hypothetical protein ABW19_dt0209390 [Dactylella cylindrospora]